MGICFGSRECIYGPTTTDGEGEEEAASEPSSRVSTRPPTPDPSHERRLHIPGQGEEGCGYGYSNNIYNL